MDSTECREEWERRALKLLKGKPLSTLRQTLSSGLNNEVVYAHRPSNLLSTHRTVASGEEKPLMWDAVSVGGRVAGRFQDDVNYTESVGRNQLLRVFQSDLVGAKTSAYRVDVLDISLNSVSAVLKQMSPKQALHCDPFFVGLMGSGFDEKSCRAVVHELDAQSSSHPLTIQANEMAELGGTATEELLWILAQLAQLSEWGIQDWSRIWIQVSLDADILQNTVKIRALRRLVLGLQSQCEAVGMPYIHGETSVRMFTLADAHNNMLRALYASVGGIWGGVDGLSIHGYDVLTTSTVQNDRIADNMHRILSEESGLHNWLDPMFGGYQVETQTAELCTMVWSELCSLPNASIFALESSWLDRLQDKRRQRQQRLSTQVEVLTGVTAFANADEKIESGWLNGASSAYVRDAQPFEALRATAESMSDTVIQVYCVGTLPEYKPRLDFLQQFLAVVGWKATPVDSLSELRSDKRRLRCVVGRESAYEAELDTIMKDLMESPKPIWLVGTGPTDSMKRFGDRVHRINRHSDILSTWETLFEQLRGERA